jgi:hypothetical protein
MPQSKLLLFFGMSQIMAILQQLHIGTTLVSGTKTIHKIRNPEFAELTGVSGYLSDPQFDSSQQLTRSK